MSGVNNGTAISPARPAAGSRIVAVYPYRDEAGELLWEKVRYEPKRFVQRRPDPDDPARRIYDMKGVRQVPYRLPELLAAAPDEWVFITEGEKGAEAVARLGLVATTNGGALKWGTLDKATVEAAFRDRPVVILPDNDDAGRRHAEQVAASVGPVAAEVRILALPDLPEKGDVADWVEAGGTAAELRKLANAAPAWQDPAGIGYNPPDAAGEQSGRRGWTWNLISSATFASGEYRPTWLVKRLLVDRAPLIIGGSEKTLKTTLAADLAVSLATGKPFLGTFDVYQARRVAFISGESGEHTLQETFVRIARAKDLTDERISAAEVLWGFDLPSLGDPVDVEEIERGIRANRVGLMIVDPAYLAALNGLDPDDAKSMFRMGPILKGFSQACIRAGATPAIVHHANKQLAIGETMELHHLAYAGFSQFAGQWLLMSRMEKYQGDGRHHLRLNAGGRCGQGGLWSLHIDEGQLAEDFTGRKWEVTVETGREAARRAEESREADRDRKKAEKVRQDGEALLAAWARQDGRSATKGHMRGVMGGWSGDRINLAIAWLVDRRKLFSCDVEVPTGRGGSGKTKVAGFIAAAAATDEVAERVGKGG